VLLWRWRMMNSRKTFLSTGSFFRKINKCIEVRGMFDGEEGKGNGFYYKGL